MFGEVVGVVAAGVEVKFMGDVARGEEFVESGGAGVEAVVVVVTAVKIDLQAGETRGAGEHNRAVLIEENRIRRTAEDTAEEAAPGRSSRSRA